MGAMRIAWAFWCCLGLASLLAGPPAARAAEGDEAAAPAEAGDRQARLLFNTASRLYRQKSWEEAARAFGDFLDRFPRHADAAEARFARGFSLYRLGRVEA